MNQKKHSKQTHNQAVKPQSAKGKPDAEYLNYKVVAKEGGSTMILSSGLSKVNAKSLENTLNSYINNKIIYSYRNENKTLWAIKLPPKVLKDVIE